MSEALPIKDKVREHPIAGCWRPVFRRIVSSFVRGDFELSAPIEGVAPVPAETAEHMRKYVADYGETLVELPDETWKSSVARWTGTRWDALVDLWTQESGRSDMVLGARVSSARTASRSGSTSCTSLDLPHSSNTCPSQT